MTAFEDFRRRLSEGIGNAVQEIFDRTLAPLLDDLERRVHRAEHVIARYPEDSWADDPGDGSQYNLGFRAGWIAAAKVLRDGPPLLDQEASHDPD